MREVLLPILYTIKNKKATQSATWMANPNKEKFKTKTTVIINSFDRIFNTFPIFYNLLKKKSTHDWRRECFP